MRWCGIEPGDQGGLGGGGAATYWSSERRWRRARAAVLDSDRCGSSTGREEGDGEY
jgi:hypothetical protein